MFSDGYISVENRFALRDEAKAKRLALQPRSPSALVAFRLLLGGVKIKAGSTAPVTQDRNYFVPGAPVVHGFSIHDEIGRSFPGLGEQDRTGNFLTFSVTKSLDKFFQSSGNNKGFFEVLVNEISRSFVASRNRNDLSGFVYLYRAIEHISYALPLFHARHSKDYVRAFNDLRALISSGDAELKFCDKFIKHIFSADPVLSTYIFRFSFEYAHHNNYEKYLRAHHQKHCQLAAGLVEVEFLKAFSFLVDIRNRFFHHLSGSNSSASSKDIKDADAFFRPINEIGYALIGLVFAKMIAAEI